MLCVVGIGPSALGFTSVPRGVTDGSLLWTFVQIRGFQTAGKVTFTVGLFDYWFLEWLAGFTIAVEYNIVCFVG